MPSDLDIALKSSICEDVNAFIEAVIKDESGEYVHQHLIHRQVQNFMQKNVRGVIELPREHGKTTQLIARMAWNIGNYPNRRFKIVSSSDDLATGKGKAVKEIIETPIYKFCFPHIRPGREWNESQFSVVREAIYPDATLECYGVISKATGGRTDELILDDPDDADVVTSPIKREANWRRVSEVWLNTLTPNSKAFIICTPWHEDDLAHKLKANGWPVLSIPIVNGRSIWERWSAEALLAKRKEIGSMAFVRGCELKPMSSEASLIKPEWFKYWTTCPALSSLVVVADPAISEREGADYTAILLIGGDGNRNYYLLNVRRERMDFPTALKANIIMAEYGQAQYGIEPLIGIESVAYQRAIPQQLRRSSRFAVVELKAEQNKFMRAARLAVHIENGNVFLKGASPTSVHPDQAIVLDEAIRFPSAQHDDTLDAFGYGVEMLANIGGRAQFKLIDNEGRVGTQRQVFDGY